MNIQMKTSLALLPFSAILIATTADAQGCFSYAGKSQSLSVSTSSGVDVGVSVAYYEDLVAEDESSRCVATASVRLSSFPSSRLAARPGDIAAAIREIVDDWGARECTVQVWYENDTGEERGEDEQCLKESFKYDKGSFWSSSREKSCWESE